MMNPGLPEPVVHNPLQTTLQDKIAIPGSSCYDIVRVGEIVRCEGWQKYTRIYLCTGKTLVSSYHIGLFKVALIPYGFFSPHKSHVINTSLIRRYRKEGIIEMEDQSEVPVSRRSRDSFVQQVLGKYMLPSSSL